MASPIAMGAIHRLEAFGTGANDMIDGTIVATRLASVSGSPVAPEFRVAGKFRADVQLVEGINVPFRLLGEALNTTSTGERARIRIGGSLEAGRTLIFDQRFAATLDIAGSLAGTVNIPDAGLAGQIVVNSGDAGDAWTGTVNVGSTSITNPAQGKYTQLSASLGGGAIGLAPFRMHELDSIPPHNQLLINQGISQRAFTLGTYPVKIRHYGPVRYVGPTPATNLEPEVEAILIDAENPVDESSLSRFHAGLRSPASRRISGSQGTRSASVWHRAPTCPVRGSTESC